MNRQVADRIDLEITGDHPVLGTVHVDVVEARQELAGVDPLAQFRVIERDVERGLIVSIDHAGYTPRASHGPGGPLAGPRTCRRLDFLDGCHFAIPCSALRQRASAPTASSPGSLNRMGFTPRPLLPTCRGPGFGPAADLQGCSGAAVACLISGASANDKKRRR